MKKWFVLLLSLWLTSTVCRAEVAESFDLQAAPGRGVPSNVAVDCISHGDPAGIWLATGKGVGYSFDGGETWYVYDHTSGLPSSNLSAIFSIAGRIWVASSHNEVISEELHALSDGLSYSDDNGETWTQVNFGSDGLDIDYVWGGDRTIYDITGHVDPGFLDNRAEGGDVDWLFFSAFAGGLLASQDGGLSWRRIYSSALDSVQFNLTTEAPDERNRYFSCAIDTSHADSVILWGGTAGGLYQYVYAQPRQKLYQALINCAAFSDFGDVEEGSQIFIGGDNGLSRLRTTGGEPASRFQLDGLPGPTVTAAFAAGDRLIVSTADTIVGLGTGLAVSTDSGSSFTPIPFAAVVGANHSVTEFALHHERLYLSAQLAGLFVSTDTGQTWARILIDSSNEASAINTAYSVSSYADTLLVGTDTGLVVLVFDGGGVITSANHTYFEESASSGSRVVHAAYQEFLNDTSLAWDSTVIWTINQSSSTAGTNCVGRRYLTDITYDFDTTVDTTFDSLGAVDSIHIVVDSTVLAYDPAWDYYLIGDVVYDIDFWTDTAFVVGNDGAVFSLDGAAPTNPYPVRQLSGGQVIATLENDIITEMAVRGDTVLVGTLDGFALTQNRGGNWRIYRPNIDTLGADLVVNHTYVNSGLGEGLTGDFIPALAVQYNDSGTARVWASSRPGENAYGVSGISVGEFREVEVDDSTTAIDLVWHAVYEDDIVWNFEFHGDQVFAASDAGLLRHDGTLDDDGFYEALWDTIQLIDVTSGDTLIAPGTSVYGVAIVDSFLWVGTDDGTVRINLDNFGDKRLFGKVDSLTASDEVYAFPVPFSPTRGQTADFHFVLDEAGSVTIEVYDFAMNLVATPVDNEYYSAGIYPSGSTQGRTWDGYNDRGDKVAVGVYYFKVVLPSGDSRWGKLAVIP